MKVPGLSKLAGGGKGNAERIDRELPYAAMMITMMASSGVSPYESFKKLRAVDLLPAIQEEAEDLTRQVEVVGYDPLTVMSRKAEDARSKLYREFLAGYVSSVRGGSSVLNFLKSKLRSIFEVKGAVAKQSIERLGTLVEAYMIMLVVVLCVYILAAVTSSATLSMALGTAVNTYPFANLMMFLLIPMASVVFMVIADTQQKSNLISVRRPYEAALLSACAVAGLLATVLLLPPLQPMVGFLGLPNLVSIGLVAASLPPSLIYLRITRTNSAAEEGMPSFIRDMTEARKTGLSPEKSILHASRRKGYGRFSNVLTLIGSQIEWGVSLKRIFGHLKERLQSWPVLVSFLMLIEAIEVGGSVDALDILAEYSEKSRDIEKEKREMLKPYIVLPFVWSALIAIVTTTLIFVLNQASLIFSLEMPAMITAEQASIFSVGIILQCWISGLFIGKVSEGTLAAGFKYSAMLTATACLSLLASQSLVSSFMGGLRF